RAPAPPRSTRRLSGGDLGGAGARPPPPRIDSGHGAQRRDRPRGPGRPEGGDLCALPCAYHGAYGDPASIDGPRADGSWAPDCQYSPSSLLDRELGRVENLDFGPLV